MPQFIQVEQRGNIKIVTLNRPDALNAISYKLAEEFHAVLDDIKYDMETRVLVITGTGRSFCAGADLKERQSYSPEERGRKTAEMCEIVTTSNADFIKTSTGFGTGGATREDVELFAKHVGPNIKIKAAGGIANLQDAEDFIKLGASRLGTSRVVKAVKAMEQ